MDGLTIHEPDDARRLDELGDHGRRLDELPDHEDDGDVDQVGSGIMQQGDTSVDRGTGQLGGLAQEGDPYDATEPAMSGDDPDFAGPGFVEDITDDNHHD